MTKDVRVSPKLKRRRQLLLVLPLLILPFVTLAFWALGGGSAEDNMVRQISVGINSKVPQANVSFRPENKMSIYAEEDRRKEDLKQSAKVFNYSFRGDSVQSDEFHPAVEGMDSRSVKIEQKLEELQAALDAAGQSDPERRSYVSKIDPSVYGLQPGEHVEEGNSDELARLNRIKDLIARSSDAASAEDGSQDKDLQQINNMLDKILAIQHPEEAEGLSQGPAQKGNDSVYSLKSPDENLIVPVLHPQIPQGKENPAPDPLSDSQMVVYPNRSGSAGPGETLTKGLQVAGGFFDIDFGREEKEGGLYTFQAEIAGSQTLVSGAAVKMRLTADVIIHGTLIPKGNFVFGTATVNGERLKVTVSHIRFRRQILPVNLTVFDLDGMEGIRVPGAIGRDASKDGADRALQSIRLMSLDPGVTAQAASAGIEAAKGLLGKKVKLVRVKVKAGYPILLLDSEGMRKARR